jgi:polyhydroxybutyrate depolymerase
MPQRAEHPDRITLLSSIMTRAGARLHPAFAVLLALHGTLLAAQTPGVEQRRALEAGGARRFFLLYLPSSYRAGRPIPLVLVFHAAGGQGRGIARHTAFSRVAEREGFAVAYPDGIGGRWNDGRRPGGPDDVGFVRSLLDSLGRELSLDSTRVYATGISNGAMFAHRLACDLPGVFAGIASVAGALPAAVAQRCAGSPAVSVIAFQGTADRAMPYEGGGVGGRGEVLSAERSAAFWAAADRCSLSPVDVLAVDSVTDGTRLRRRDYGGCAGGRSVVLYTVEGGGHTWPGGPPGSPRVGRVSREIDATRAIWDFFQRQGGH